MNTRSRFLFLGSLALGVVLGLFVSIGLQKALSPAARLPETLSPPGRSPEAEASPLAQSRVADPPDLEPEERHTIALFKEAQGSVAFITTQVERVDYWTRNVFEVPSGSGSGFVWDDRGHVVTNFHVVKDADSAKVRL